MNIRYKILVTSCIVYFSLVSCRKFLDVEVPKSNIERNLVFDTDVTATAAVLGIYIEMYTGAYTNPFGGGKPDNLSGLTGLSSDELTHPSLSNQFLIEFEDNGITSMNPANSDLWKSLYKVVYQANTVIGGVENNSSLTPFVKNQLLGEGYFIRAFCHFYLANLFGDVPLILNTNYKENALAERTAASTVLDQVTKDLIKAYELLNETYISDGSERIRPNKSTAASMLSRVYLYLEKWNEAEQYATSVINKKTLYSLENDITKVFLKNSQETIWQLKPVTYNNNQNGATNEALNFSAENAPYYNVCTEDLLSSFEDDDARYTQWIQPTNDPKYFSPSKYRHFNNGESLTEYSMVIRLAEMHLIRAEARAMQNKLLGADGAEFDINEIRKRANLPLTVAKTQEELMSAIVQERRVELFSEWGHRWLDLKRWGKANEILSEFKGSNWQSTDVLYPLPESEMTKNPNLRPQNGGYNY